MLSFIFINKFLFLLPLLILLFIILKYKNVHIAVSISIISIFLILYSFNNYSIVECLNKFIEINKSILFSPDYFYPIIFLFLITLISTVLTESNLIHCYEYYAKKIITSKKKLQIGILSLGYLVCIDDYLIIMSIKSFFQPLINTFNLSKEKFAYLISTSASPIASVIPISSWTAIYLGQLNILIELLNLNTTPYALLMQSIPYCFYSFIVIITTWFIVLNNISFGSMKKYENIINKDQTEDLNQNKKPIIFDTIFTIIPHLSIFSAIAYSFINLKNQYQNKSIFELIEFITLPKTMTIGALIGLLLLFIYLKYNKKNINLKFFNRSLYVTYDTLFMSILRLLLCWIFSKCLILLIDIPYLSSILIRYSFIEKILPLFFFIFTSFIAFVTSSSWASIGVVTAMIAFFPSYDNIPLLFGAIISGSTCGVMFTPLSDSIGLPSVAANVEVIRFFDSQKEYTALNTSIAIIFYLVTGFVKGYFYNLIIFVILIKSIFKMLKYFNKKN